MVLHFFLLAQTVFICFVFYFLVLFIFPLDKSKENEYFFILLNRRVKRLLPFYFFKASLTEREWDGRSFLSPVLHGTEYFSSFLFVFVVVFFSFLFLLCLLLLLLLFITGGVWRWWTNRGNPWRERERVR